ncbi:aminotransferase class I/II-fold pyridoxal phosphate-dependent enzyme [Lactobacillus sp. LC28-10]|uniref:Aminotransferase n=1 Tax=Secundilactobacillus angelensis TaxID=2722706 RepID=A0ABX1KYS2_9LACO|nr:aminotransferase class I/II-fold pyridoxal phosphate-dependent enzyme [Secundilactobacillus angelensis]MCH5462753.1 aminotransferase class I/II-fold pyridoxal phosphate-dependent enzyme [Secundilactobacillus angelensis]NLR19093.1 aminotransferase class I/II-fold pyridoxal phosphate-dependent enzyme [Secundilactobacillus angelensis]
MDINELNPDVLSVKPSALRAFDHEISADPEIVKLTLGEPDFNVPEHIKQAAIDSINADQSHYPYYWGIQELRDAASTYYREKFGYQYSADQIVCTVGATEGLAASFKTLFQPGDGILIPMPAYPVYKAIAGINHLVPIMVDTTDTGCVLTPEQVKEAIATHPEVTIKGVVITDPSNPTGVVYSEEQLAALVPVFRDNHIWIISDEIYGELTYGVKHYSLSKWLPEQTIIINGLSKSHAMTGWRIGFVFGPTGVIDQIAKAHQFQVTTPTSIVQYASVEALTHGQNDAEAMRKIYQQRCEYLTQELDKLGMKYVKPRGAFYIFVKIPEECHQDSFTFAHQLAKNYHVGLMPGAPFGDPQALRISYASSNENLHAAVDALKKELTRVGAIAE